MEQRAKQRAEKRALLQQLYEEKKRIEREQKEATEREKLEAEMKMHAEEKEARR